MNIKTLKNSGRVLAFAAIMLVTLLMPELASAKWSKACSKFTYDGVKVEVVDRRDKIGKSHSNTYGYVDFVSGDAAVTIDWKCFGVLKGSQKLVLITDESFSIGPKQRRGQTYSYHVGHFQLDDFEKYVVAIQVTKEKPEVPVADAVTEKNMDRLYASLMKKKGSFSQEDYSQAIDWLRFAFKTKLAPMTEAALEKAWTNQEHAESMANEIAVFANQWAALADYVTDADDRGELNSENHKKFKNLQKEVESVMN